MSRWGISGRSGLIVAAGNVNLLAVLTAACLLVSQAVAAPTVSVPTEPGSPEPTQPATGSGGCLSQISRSGNLLCDMWGLRPFLSQYGISLSLTETAKCWAT